MNFILPCFENMIHVVFNAKQVRKRVAAKKYSAIDHTPPLQDNANMSQLFEQTMPNSLTGETNADFFIMPSVDADTSDQANPGNLLISKCEGGSFVIMRSLQNVYIDTCSNIFTFIGPCHSTLFIRNCQNIRVRAIAQQLRIENSQNIIIEGIVGVRPVLQQCKNIQFFALNSMIYEDLVWQIEKSKVDIFNNQIYECYDFTPKKQPNFSNGQKINNEEIDALWEAKIQMNDLDWGMKNVYLPNITTVKKSMLKKIYTEYQVKKNPLLVVVFTKMNFKEFLATLSSPGLGKKVTIIQKLNAEIAFKILRGHQNYRQQVNSAGKEDGEWFFIVIKTSQKICKQKIKLKVIDERDLVWKLFDKQNRDK